MTLKSLQVLGSTLVFGSLMSLSPEAQAAREVFNRNNCREHLSYLVHSLRNAGLKSPEVTALMREARTHDPAVTSFRVDAETAAFKNNYMPLSEGGVDYPWSLGQSADRAATNKYFFEGGVYDTSKLLKAAEIRKNVFEVMSDAELNGLSPIRKYALFVGDYGMNVLRTEIRVRGPERVKYQGMPKIESWEGFCYPMRTTGCLLPEPNKVFTVTLKDGSKTRQLEFSPNDIKALLAVTYENSEFYARAGNINRAPRDTDPVNAGAYHIFKRAFRIMKTKYKGKPYAAIFDVEPNSQLWNEGFQNFDDTVSPMQLLTDAQKKDWEVPAEATHYVEVKDTIQLTHEASLSETNRATRADVAAGRGLNSESYEYRLYLNAKGEIIEGDWVNHATGRKFPDFIGWPNGRGDPAGGGNADVDFDKVMDLLELGTTETAMTIPGRR